MPYKLLRFVTEETRRLGMKRICAETRASNLAMQKVFEDCGFRLSKREEEYFDDNKECAFKYVLEL